MLRFLLCAMCVLVPVVGWTQSATTDSDFNYVPDWKRSLPQQQEPLRLFRISGSNSVGAHLAPQLVQSFLAAEGFRNVQVQPVGENEAEISAEMTRAGQRIAVTVTVAAHGTGTGFKALELGDAELAAASRPVSDAEKSSLAGLGVMDDSEHEHIIAIDGLAVIVHPGNPVKQLTVRQINDLFTGKIRNWREVGGKLAPVKIYARNQASGTFDTFERLVLNGAKLDVSALRFESNDQLANAVQGNESGIGFVPLASIGKAKAVAVSDGVAQALRPTQLTVATEDYPLARRLYFYAPGSAQRSAALNAFLNYVVSDEGQKVVPEAGYIAQALHPVSVNAKDERLQSMKRLNVNIRFSEGSSELDNKALMDVSRLAEFLQLPQQASTELTLVGYSSPDNTDKRAVLSRLRAQNVRWALREVGVTVRLETIGGEAVAVADPASINADRNRRVEVWIP